MFEKNSFKQLVFHSLPSMRLMCVYEGRSELSKHSGKRIVNQCHDFRNESLVECIALIVRTMSKYFLEIIYESLLPPSLTSPILLTFLFPSFINPTFTFIKLFFHSWYHFIFWIWYLGRIIAIHCEI